MLISTVTSLFGVRVHLFINGFALGQKHRPVQRPKFPAEQVFVDLDKPGLKLAAFNDLSPDLDTDSLAGLKTMRASDQMQLAAAVSQHLNGCVLPFLEAAAKRQDVV